MSPHLVRLNGVIALVLLVGFGSPLTAAAQQWSAAQKEVWSAVSGMCVNVKMTLSGSGTLRASLSSKFSTCRNC